MNNNHLFSGLNDLVYGHEEAKKALIVLLKRSLIRHQQKFLGQMLEQDLVSPLKILMMGASGTGKTYLIKCLQSLQNFPLICVDAMKLTPTGNGEGVNADKLGDMIYENALMYTKMFPTEFFSVEGAIDRTVVFIDEIDKLASSFDGSSRGKWNTHTQTNFLTLFDNKDKFAGVSFIFAGAFTDLRPTVKVKSLGFTPVIDKSPEKISDDDLTKFGLLPEIVGRINYIVELDKLTEDDFKKILLSILWPKKSQDLFYVGLTDIVLSDESVGKIAHIGYTSGQGVRAMQRELEKLFLDIEFDSSKNLLRAF